MFLGKIDSKFWSVAGRLRANLDAAFYKHVVLGLIFLKYVSDAFDLRQDKLGDQFRNAGYANYLDPDNFENVAEQEVNIKMELEERDYYTEENVFRVPGLARWGNIKTNARLANGTEIEVRNGKIGVASFETKLKAAL